MQNNQTLYEMFFIQRVHVVNNAALILILFRFNNTCTVYYATTTIKILIIASGLLSQFLKGLGHA